MGYVEGVPQTKLKILEYGIYVRQDADAISFINSFSDRKKMCGNDWEVGETCVSPGDISFNVVGSKQFEVSNDSKI